MTSTRVRRNASTRPNGEPNRREGRGWLSARMTLTHHHRALGRGVDIEKAMRPNVQAAASTVPTLGPDGKPITVIPAQKKARPRALTHSIPVPLVHVDFVRTAPREGHPGLSLQISGISLRKQDYQELGRRLARSGYAIDLSRLDHRKGVAVTKVKRPHLTAKEVVWLRKKGFKGEMAPRFLRFPLSEKDVQFLVHGLPLNGKERTHFNALELTERDVNRIQEIVDDWRGYY